MQIQLTGFLDKDTAGFCKELWKLCLSAQSNPQGVPKELLEAKKLELIQEKVHMDILPYSIRSSNSFARLKQKRPLRTLAGDARKINAETANLIASVIGSGENAAAVVEGATAGEGAEIETSTEVAEGGLIGEALDIQDHRHPVGATPGTVVRSGTPCHDPIHTCQVGGDEIIEEDLQL